MTQGFGSRDSNTKNGARQGAQSKGSQGQDHRNTTQHATKARKAATTHQSKHEKGQRTDTEAKTHRQKARDHESKEPKRQHHTTGKQLPLHKTGPSGPVRPLIRRAVLCVLGSALSLCCALLLSFASSFALLPLCPVPLLCSARPCFFLLPPLLLSLRFCSALLCSFLPFCSAAPSFFFRAASSDVVRWCVVLILCAFRWCAALAFGGCAGCSTLVNARPLTTDKLRDPPSPRPIVWTRLETSRGRRLSKLVENNASPTQRGIHVITIRQATLKQLAEASALPSTNRPM